jgi:hypothetical protein
MENEQEIPKPSEESPELSTLLKEYQEANEHFRQTGEYTRLADVCYQIHKLRNPTP